MLDYIKKEKTKDWEIEHSTLSQLSNKPVTYEQCRNYSCMDIVNNLTHLPDNLPFVYDLPNGTDFNFLVRIDTTDNYRYNPFYYYQTFEKRHFASFSTITKKNISHYKYRGRTLLLAYNIPPEAIVHVFPADSDINTHVDREEWLTRLPSIWLNSEELNSLTLQLGVYNQITCKTKINGNILKPFAVIVFDKLDDYAKSVAKEFGIGCIVLHPDHDAIHYCGDIYYDKKTLEKASDIMMKLYQIELLSHLYLY